MKRRLFSLLLAAVLCLSLCAAAFAAPDISGRYEATSCKKDGISYNSEGEYLELNADGTGVVTFSTTPYKIEWTLKGSGFSFEDEDGYGMEGTYRNGVISGNYAGYDFVYELAQSTQPTASPTPTPAPTASPTPAVVPAADSAAMAAAAGTYQAISCERDGKNYVCEEDYLDLNADGTGSIFFNGTPYSLEWSLDGDAFVFADEDGDIMEGTLSGGLITGRYAGYDYIFERGEVSLVDTSVIPGAYYPQSCTQNGESFGVQGEYIVLNEDGSAMLVYDYCAFPSSWELSGDAFMLRDNRGSVMTGTLSGGRLECDYRSYHYVYGKGTDAPIMTLSPDNWGKGLPYVTDQADILSSSEESALAAEAQALAAKYNCGVYIVTLDNMNKFSGYYNRVETCAEEIRVGYDLGLGSDRNCILLLMSMAERDYDLCVYGPYADETFNEYARSTIEKAMLDNFRSNDWSGGYADYLAQCGKILEMAESGKPLTERNDPAKRTGAAFVSLVLAFLISLIFCSVKKRKMRSVTEKREAMDYIPANGVNIAFRQDQFVNSTVVRVYDPPESKSSGGGGGGGGHSSSGHSHSSGKF